MTAVNGTVSSSASGNAAPTGSQADAFAAASGSSASTGLTVSGNSIDTGRYVITGSNSYTRPNDGTTASDGMVTIMDKTTNSFVEVYGDPHVYTSDGDLAEFQKDGLQIDLADGTQVQFNPTAQTNGFAHIAGMSVTKDDQTVVEQGFYSADRSAKVTTGPVQLGGPSSAQGFNDPNATVVTTAPGGGLNTLVNAAGVQLNDKTNQTSLDGMGGAANAPGTISPDLVSLIQKLVTLLRQQMSASEAGAMGSGALMSGNSPGQTTQTAPSQGTGASPAAPGSNATSVQKLIGLLQSELSSLSAGAAPASPASAAPAGPASSAPTGPQGSAANYTSAGSQGGQADFIQKLVSLLQQLLTQLSGSAAGGSQAAGSSGGAGADLASLLEQLLPLLRQRGPTAASTGNSATAIPQAVGSQPTAPTKETLVPVTSASGENPASSGAAGA